MIFAYLVGGVFLLLVVSFIVFFSLPAKRVKRSDLPDNKLTTQEIQQQNLNKIFKSEKKSKENSQSPIDLIEATCVGSTAPEFPQREQYFMTCGKTDLVCRSVKSNQEVRIGYSEIEKIEILGSGIHKTDAGVIGGGFGIEGFIKGAALAAAINTITTKVHNNTFLHVKLGQNEILFHIAKQEPIHLRRLLGQAFDVINSKVTPTS